MISSFRIPLVAMAITLSASFCMGGDTTPLGKEMDKMKDAMKALGKALESPSDANKAQYVSLAGDFITAATAAKKLEPEKTGTLPEADREKFLAEYHKGMDKLIGQAEKLKEQLAAGHWDKAGRELKQMGNTRKAGHKEFRLHKD